MSNPSAPRPLKVVAVSGSLQAPSKTTALVNAIIDAIAKERAIEAHVVELAVIGPQLSGAVLRSQLPANVEAELQRIEGADLIIAASPVYRASFTGLFKHLFDFIDQYALVDKPVLLGATGGSDRHALIIEHHLRPLFGFFQAVTLPLGVYANNGDFADYRVTSTDLNERISLAVARALPLLSTRVFETRPTRW